MSCEFREPHPSPKPSERVGHPFGQRESSRRGQGPPARRRRYRTVEGDRATSPLIQIPTLIAPKPGAMRVGHPAVSCEFRVSRTPPFAETERKGRPPVRAERIFAARAGPAGETPALPHSRGRLCHTVSRHTSATKLPRLLKDRVGSGRALSFRYLVCAHLQGRTRSTRPSS